MKKIFMLLLAVLLIFTGCAGRVKANDVSVKDISYPYEIRHAKGAVEITLWDAANRGTSWTMEAIPNDVCEVTREDAVEAGADCYRVVGIVEGAAQLTFSAVKDDATAIFSLTLVINVDSKGRAVATSCEHWEREGASVEADGLEYTWSVDETGLLSFSFSNPDDFWRVEGDGENVCTLITKMATPSGCMFTAQPKDAGQTTIKLVGAESQREVHVVVQADENGKLTIVSVQEQ
jgi:hypothetical protein